MATMTAIGAAIGVVVGLFAKSPTNLIPTPHQEANQIAYLFEVGINRKAPLALVCLDVCENLVGAGPVEPRAERQTGRVRQ